MKNVKRSIILWLALIVSAVTMAQSPFPLSSQTLSNGMKVIVCEKPGNDFVQVELWYKTGSKDEKPGIRGMAHLFEHMMFRGTEKYPGDAYFKNIDKVGGSSNAYTTYDRTVYHAFVPTSSLELVLDMESDRMANLKVTQEILDVEREVVGEELRLGENNWYGRMNKDRYPHLYPEGHPYEVDVIGFLEEITAFTSEQCMEFYNNFYSPNNAYLVVVGNVKSATVFSKAKQYFEPITKQLEVRKKENVPDVFSYNPDVETLPLDFPVQIYSYTYPRPATDHQDALALSMFTDLVFLDDYSILNNRIVKKDHSAYGFFSATDNLNLYPNRGVIDVVMDATFGNVKVKKAVREEINKVVAEGIGQERIDLYIQSLEAAEQLGNYRSGDIALRLGLAEYYYGDFKLGFNTAKAFKQVTSEDLKRIASTYFSEDNLHIINIKPTY